MKTWICKVALLPVLLAGLITSTVSAQELAEGVWEGVRTDPSETLPPVGISIRVEKAPEGEMSIVVLHVLGSRRATDIEFEDGVLRYSFEVPGRDTSSDCVLSIQDDASLKGECSGDNGALFVYSFMPPG